MSNVTIQELSMPGCAHCAAVRETLEEEIQPQFPEIELEFIDMLTDEGQDLMQRYGVMTSPGIIVNGELFSVGEMDKDELIAKIKELS